MTIQALTLAQPWPAMMLLDEQPKRIENRDWTPPRKLLGGYVALHGGRLPKSKAEFAEARAALEWVDEYVFQDESGEPWDDDSILKVCVPGIYAVARVQEVLTASDDPWFVGTYGWLLTDFTPLDPPVPCRGAQKLWDVPAEALALVRERWKAAQLPAPAAPPVPVFTGPVCATCRHAESNWELMTCTLGWEAHEAQFWASKKPNEFISGSSHEGVPVPLLSPQARCMALGGDKWLPRKEAMA